MLCWFAQSWHFSSYRLVTCILTFDIFGGFVMNWLKASGLTSLVRASWSCVRYASSVPLLPQLTLNRWAQRPTPAVQLLSQRSLGSRNRRRPGKANHGKRPVSHARRREKKKQLKSVAYRKKIFGFWFWNRIVQLFLPSNITYLVKAYKKSLIATVAGSCGGTVNTTRQVQLLRHSFHEILENLVARVHI